jgi:hypothetical protein
MTGEVKAARLLYGKEAIEAARLDPNYTKAESMPDGAEDVSKLLKAYQACGLQGDEESDSDFVVRLAAELKRS